LNEEKEKRQYSVPGRDCFNFSAYSRLVFETQRVGPDASPGIREDREQGEYQPTKQFLKNPLTSGDSWTWKGKGMMGIEIDESNEVSGPETVSVAAGKFEAMKVMTKVVQGGAPVTKTYWYAPGVGLVKSMTDTGSVKSTTELIAHPSSD
jgi:hypothetical protein